MGVFPPADLDLEHGTKHNQHTLYLGGEMIIFSLLWGNFHRGEFYYHERGFILGA